MTALTAFDESIRSTTIRPLIDDRMHGLQSQLRWLAATTPTTRDEVEEIRFLMGEVERELERLTTELSLDSWVNST